MFVTKVWRWLLVARMIRFMCRNYYRLWLIQIRSF